MTPKIKKFIKKLATNKLTGIEGASSRKIAAKIKRKFSLKISTKQLIFG